MTQKTGKTSKLAAALLVVVNLIVMVICAILFSLGLWMVSSPRSMADVIQVHGTPLVKALLPPQVLNLQVGVGLVVLSTFFFFLALMGCYGAISRSPFLLFMYAALVILLLLLESALVFYFSSTLIEKGLLEQDGQWTHMLRLSFSCCEHNTSTVLMLPWSCCGVEAYPDHCNRFQIASQNCNEVIPRWLHRYQTAIYGSLAVLHIIMSSCSLLRRSRASLSNR